MEQPQGSVRIKPLGKILILVVVVGLAIGAWRIYQKYIAGGSSAPGVGCTTVSGGDQGLLGRPLRVGVVSWPGYAGGIVANNGFKPNRDCIFFKNHKQTVEFVLLEDPAQRSQAFAKGEGGVDVVWSTVDYWANELPGFLNNGVKARAIMQVDWSRGGD